MEIRKDTWHYPVWRFFTRNPDGRPTSLCGYVVCIVTGSVSTATVIVSGILTFALFGWIVWESIPSIVDSVPATLSQLGMICGWTFIVICALVGLYLLIFLVGLGYSFFRESETIRLFTAYLKAKKDKICPLITFVEPV